jgi:hypothetical protein
MTRTPVLPEASAVGVLSAPRGPLHLNGHLALRFAPLEASADSPDQLRWMIFLSRHTRDDAQGVVTTATPCELAPNLARLEAARRLPEAN